MSIVVALWIFILILVGAFVAIIVSLMNDKQPDQDLTSKGSSGLSGHLNATALGSGADFDGSVFEQYEDRRERVLAKREVHRERMCQERMTAQATGPSRRQGRL